MDSLFNKVLITGASGFTGKYLTKYLEEKQFFVYGLSNELNDDSTLLKCDITDKDSIVRIINEIKPNYIIHLAAISFVQHNDVQEIYNVNVLGTENLLEACKSFDFIKKVILASSATIYGNQSLDTYHEALCPNPINHYGISKYAMEQIAKNYFQIVPIIIVRPFNYTAPGQSINFIIPKIADAFKYKRANIELGNLNTYREYNSIEFICNAYYELLVSDVKSEIFNLASGTTHSLNEILAIFYEFTQHKLNISINSKFIRKNEIIKLAGNAQKLNALLTNKSDNDIRSIIKSFL